MTGDAGPGGNAPARADALDTRLVHLGPPPGQQFGYVNPPVYRGSTALYDGPAGLRRTQADPLKRDLPAYGRFGTPTVRAFEAALSTLEGGHAAVVTCSGLAAITTAVLAFVRSGDHVLVSDSVYPPTRRFCDSLEAFGISTQYYDPCLGSGIERLLRPNTRLVYLESPGSGTFEVMDVPAVTQACRRRDVTTIVDNTWATPFFCRPIGLGADVVVHSASKYLAGHADIVLGAVVATEESYPAVRRAAIRLGQYAGPDDAYLALRGLRTLGVRMRQHERSALELARWLSSRPEVSDVVHPALDHHPGHLIWKRDFSGAAGPFGLLLHPRFDERQVAAMLQHLRLFGLGYSWGGYESLIVPSDPGVRVGGDWPRPGTLLRVHVGMEDVEDLKADLRGALAALRSADEDVRSPGPTPSTV